MINNERGSTLLTVILISVVFLILGMSIITATIGNVKRTETRGSEIAITYNAIEAVDVFTTTLAKKLQKFPITAYRLVDFTDSNSALSVKNEYNIELLRQVLLQTATDFLENEFNTANLEMIECMNIIDVSGNTPRYLLDTNELHGACLGDLSINENYQQGLNLPLEKDFTRVYDFILITKNPIELQGDVGRFTSKRYILSPIPSFLRYTVGSSSYLTFNGSSHIHGDIFANHLTISPRANYTDINGIGQQTDTTQPLSVIGDIYSTTAQPIKQLVPANFYKGQIPDLLHDSQFANINFDLTFLDRLQSSLATIPILNTIVQYASSKDSLFTNVESEITNLISNQLATPPSTSTGMMACIDENEEVIPYCWQNVPEILEVNEYIHLSGDVFIGNNSSKLTYKKPIIINGNLTISASSEMVFEQPIYVKGTITILSSGPVTFFESLYIDGTTIIYANSPTKFDKHIISTNTIQLTNLTTDVIVEGSILSLKNLQLSALSQETSTSLGLKVNGDIITQLDANILTENMKIHFNNQLYIGGNLTMAGNDEDNSYVDFSENDEIIFDSVVYVNKETTISNTNISTADQNTKHLILLSKGKLLLTRINEFNYYAQEIEFPDYLPSPSEAIKPIKGFFYTEGDAELYGVGSLFYIHGGIFAKGELVINAVRGKTYKGSFTPLEEENKTSRFIVKYDESVLYNRLSALPIVEHLQLYISDSTLK